MREKDDISSRYWKRFLRSGQVTDYLRYKENYGDDINPRRRIADSSKNKEFY